MNTEVIAQWRSAESTLGRPRAVERAAKGLPERLSWILRAMSALDEGKTRKVSTLADEAREAGQLDIAALLDLLVSDPKSINPKNVRKAAKKAGAGSELSLPFLDLLRATATMRQGDTSKGNGAFKKFSASSKRPAFDAAAAIMTSKDRANYSTRTLIEFSERADQLQTCARLLRNDRIPNQSWLKYTYENLHLDFSNLQRWPDLAGVQDIGPLKAWLDGSGQWSQECEAIIDQSLSYEEATRKTYLGGLLKAIEGRIAEGKVQGLTSVVVACENLASSLPGEAAFLSEQLAALYMRLQWIELQRPPGELLEELWRSGHPTVQERLTLAHTLQQNGTRESDQEIMIESLFWILAHTPKTEDALLHLDRLAANNERKTFLPRLQQAGASVARQEFLSAWRMLKAGRVNRALKHTFSLLESKGDFEDAMKLVVELLKLTTPIEAQPSTLRAHLNELFGQLAELNLPASRWLTFFLGLDASQVPPSLANAAKSSLLIEDHSAQEVAARIFLPALLADSAASQEATKRFGRSLRKIRPEEVADNLALQVSAYLVAWQRKTPSGGKDLQESIDRFLFRSGAQGPLQAALRLPPSPEVAEWFITNRDILDEDPAWLSILAKTFAPTPLMAVQLRSIIEVILAHGVHSFPRFLERLQEGIQRLEAVARRSQ